MNNAKMNKLKVVIIGAGAIGARHFRTIHSLGLCNITVFDPDRSALAKLEEAFPHHHFFSDYSKVLAQDFDAAIICSPPHLHISQALDFTEKKCDLFIEKPLSHSSDMKGLVDIIRRRRLVSMVACNMRFHPAIRDLNEAVSKNSLGRIFHFRLEVAAYLPEWRKGKDYRKNYAASHSQGGGIILDAIHELDYARWIFSDLKNIKCVTSKVGKLKINTEDTAEISFMTERGAIGSIFCSYLSRPYHRGYLVLGEKTSMRWDFSRGVSEIYSVSAKKWNMFGDYRAYEFNSCYKEMFVHFFGCVLRRKKTICDVEDGYQSLKDALFARKAFAELKKS